MVEFENELYKTVLGIDPSTKNDNVFFDQSELPSTSKLRQGAMDVNVRYCRREGHELGTIIVQDPGKKDAAKLKVMPYAEDGKNSRDIVTLVYFWEYPSGVDEATETQELKDIVAWLEKLSKYEVPETTKKYLSEKKAKEEKKTDKEADKAVDDGKCF